MIATAEPDAQVDDVIDAEFQVERSTAVSKIECPVALPVVNDLRAKYGALAIAGIDDKAGFSAVDEARKHCKRVRVQVENWRKEQNEEALKHQRRVNAAAKLIREPLELLEDTLAGKQKAVMDEVERLKREAEEKLKAERAAKLKARMDALAAVKTYQIPSEVEKFTDEGFQEFLAVATKENNDRVAQEAEAKRLFEQDQERQRQEEERLAAERKRLDDERAEFERLKKEQAAREAEAQRKIDDEKARLEKLEADRLAAIETERREAERVERERIEAERKEQQAEAARLRAEALRPDREKLITFCDSIATLEVPLEVPFVREEVRLVRSLIVAGLKDAAADLRGIVESRLN